MKNTIKLSIMTLITLLVSTLSAHAQTTGAAVTGFVLNPQGEAVAGAQISANNQATNQIRTVVTGAEGAYRIPSLIVGTYEITVQAEGYADIIRQQTLLVGEEARVNFELTVAGEAGETATVSVISSHSPSTEMSTSVLGVVVENKQITQLPINGRNFLELSTLVPNVNTTASLRSGAEGGARNGPFAVAGQRDRSLTFLVDGVDSTNSLSDSLSARISIDAIQEFKMIISLAAAEHGYHSGGVINIVTRSGSNDFRFSLFEFLRNKKLNAPNHFERLVGQPASPFSNNQFGGTVSGPVLQDKMFFLANYEGQRLRSGSPQFSNVPTVEERRGLFRSPVTGQNVQLPVDPVSAEILRRYVPLPNTASEFGNYLATPIATAQNDFALFRMDHLLSGNDVLNARYYIYNNTTFYAINPEEVRFTGYRPATIPGFGINEPSRTQNLAISHTHNFNAQTVNELRFGYNRYFLNQVSETQIRPQEVGFTGVQEGTGSLVFATPGISTLGNNAYPIFSNFGNFHVSEALSFLSGSHALKVGGEVRLVRQSLQHFEPGHAALIFNGRASSISPVADLVMGVPAAAVVFQRPFASPMRQTVAGLFIQDDYQFHKRLTLNLGLRYELATVLNSPTHALTNFSFERGLFTPGVDTDTGLYRGDHNNFAPRIGFAWLVTEDGRTVLRGGYGLFYDTLVHTTANRLNQQTDRVNPFVKTSIAPRGPGRLAGLLNPSMLFGVAGPSYAYDENLRTPYAQHFNLTLQRELTNTLVVSLGYVGSKGTKLTSAREINQAIYLPGRDALGRPRSTADPLNIDSRRPSQLFKLTPFPVRGVEQIGAGASSSYHSFQTTFNKRIGHGLSLRGAYTWSKSIDDSSDPYGFTGDSGIAQDSNNVRAERGLSIFDVRHQATLGYTYQLPFQGNRWVTGWQVNGIATARAGQPFTAILGFDPALTGNTVVRPNNVPGAFINQNGQVTLNPDLPLDRATGVPVALIPAPGQVGNLGRNTLTGPGYKNLDMSLTKETLFGERFKVQFRFEMFNVTNTTNLALPERRLTNVFFGRSTKTQDVASGVPGIGGGGPRILQLGLRLDF